MTYVDIYTFYFSGNHTSRLSALLELRTPLGYLLAKIIRLVLLRTGTGIQMLGALDHAGNSEGTDRRTTACTGHEAAFSNIHPSCRMQCDLGRSSSRMETKS